MDIDWIDMVHYRQQVQKLSRMLLPSKQEELTAGECELLAWLYLKPEGNTPIMLSQYSGMKKEAVSRCLKSLYEKNCIRKEKLECDERSYKLFITDFGCAELEKGYKNILQPFYDLWRNVGSDFEKFLQYADNIVRNIEDKRKREDN